MTDLASPERSSRWRNADAHAAGAAVYLDLLTKLLDAQKKQTIELLRLGEAKSVIEIGCGIGRDSEAMAALVGKGGRVVGMDASKALSDQAKERTGALGLPLEFQVGDAHALAFPDNSFDAARVDRVLQHLADPAKAITELARVVRPGGRIAVLEPDWETVTVAGGDIAISHAVVRHKVDVSIAHGRIGRNVRRLLVEAGCGEITAEASTVTFGQLELADRVMSLKQNLEGARDLGWITADAAAGWWSALEALDRTGGFFAFMTGVMAGATVGATVGA